MVLSSLNHSRSSLLSSDVSAEEYMVRMQRESDRMDQNDSSALSTNSPLIEYEIASEQALCISKAADIHNPARQQCVPTAEPTLNKLASENVFNA